MIAALRTGGTRLREMVRSRAVLLGQTGWVIASFGAQQVMRVGLSIVLAHLLAPELFGIMLLINTFRTGAELLSDIGIGQNIIRSPRGEQQDFLNTAWTLQIIRGIVLFLITLLIAKPFAHFFDNPQLELLLPLAGSLFIILGLQVPSRYVLNKRLDLKRFTYMELWTGLASVIIHISLALYSPTIWALIFGLLLTAPLNLLNSFLIMPKAKWKLEINRGHAREILSFGKWIFISSLVYFLSMNFDRLYFAKAVPAVTLGVYGISRTFADTIVMLVQNMANLIVFPRISASSQRGGGLQKVIATTRLIALTVVSVGLALVVVMSDQLIYLLYDTRYHDAAFYLPILMFGAWFTVLGALAEGMMLGVGLSRGVALANGFKLLWIAVTVPLALHHFGMMGAPFAYILGDAVRYCALAWQKRQAKLSFIRHDILLTTLFVLLTLGFRELSHMVGLTTGVSGWLELLWAVRA